MTNTQMQDQKSASEAKLENAKERLKISLTELDNLIILQNNTLKEEQKIRAEIMRDLDGHIEKLESILNDE